MRRFNGIETMEETEITYRVGHFDKGYFSGHRDQSLAGMYS